MIVVLLLQLEEIAVPHLVGKTAIPAIRAVVVRAEVVDFAAKRPDNESVTWRGFRSVLCPRQDGRDGAHNAVKRCRELNPKNRDNGEQRV